MNIKRIIKYIVGISLILVVLYLLIPLDLRYRTYLDSNRITKVFITRDYFDAEKNTWASDSIIELNNKDEIQELISLIQGTPSIFSFKSVTDYNSFNYNGTSDAYDIVFIMGDSEETKHIIFTNKHLKVNGKINSTYRVFHSLDRYKEYFTDLKF